MNHIVKLINVELCFQGLSPLNLHLEASVIEIILTFVH